MMLLPLSLCVGLGEGNICIILPSAALFAVVATGALLIMHSVQVAYLRDDL